LKRIFFQLSTSLIFKNILCVEFKLLTGLQGKTSLTFFPVFPWEKPGNREKLGKYREKLELTGKNWNKLGKTWQKLPDP